MRQIRRLEYYIVLPTGALNIASRHLHQPSVDQDADRSMPLLRKFRRGEQDRFSYSSMHQSSLAFPTPPTPP